jgi:hypothetical protein
MAPIRVTTTTDVQWGNLLLISNGRIEAAVTLDFGPRVVRFQMAGGPNMFFENPEGDVGNDAPDIAQAYGEGKTWRIRGGHRLWTSPEHMPRTYYPDDDPVPWTAVENGAVLTPPAEQRNHVQKQLEIRMRPDRNEVEVIHRVTNTGHWDAEFAVWALSVMAPGGTAIVPFADRGTGLLPNRQLVLWPYTNMNDARVTWGEKAVILRQRPDTQPFKIGTNNEKGWAAYAKEGHLFVKTYRPVIDGVYPDYGVSFETYTNGLFLELETLSELQRVRPGQTVEHAETWRLFEFAEPDWSDERSLIARIESLLDER